MYYVTATYSIENLFVRAIFAKEGDCLCFVTVLDPVYHKEDTISLFCKNCTSKGILNAISRRDIVHFADLAAIVQKYYAMESTWKTQTDFGTIRLSLNPSSELKGQTLISYPIQLPKNQSPMQGVEPYWRNGSMGHAKFTDRKSVV